MALSKCSVPGAPEADLEQLNILPKLTTIDLIGGILCHICHSTFRNKKEYDNHYVSHNTGILEIMYTCVVCTKHFTGYPSFRGHCYLKHIVKDKFKCEHCEKLCSKQSVLKKHIKTVHNFECPVCEKCFPSKKEFQVHSIIHKKEKDKPPYNCKACGNKIDTADMCEQHIDETSSITFPCPICDDMIETKAGAIKHVAKHFNNIIIADEDEEEEHHYTEDSSIDMLGILCCYCGTIFKNRMELDIHFVEEHGDKDTMYTCNICQKKYDNYPNFGSHCHFHLNKDRFECTECGKTFPRLSLLIVHTDAFHSSPNNEVLKPFQCSCCGHAFKSQRRLVDHIRHLHGVHCIKCPEDGCDRSFASLKDLILHQRIHKSPSKNWCHICGLQFTSLTSCEKHLDVHRRKSYNCPVCNREYGEKYLLIKHIPVHFEMVLHICKICGKSYNARSRLIQHSKTHTAARSYICTLCGKGFYRPNHLTQHMNIHTGLKPFKCTVCPKTFASHPNLTKHVRRMHNVDGKTQKNCDDISYTQSAQEDKPRIVGKNIESGIESASSEMSVETYSMAESDDSTMNGIDPIALEKELQIINNNIKAIGDDFGDLIPPNSVTLVVAETESKPPAVQPLQPTSYPAELGPDFINTDAELVLNCLNNGEFINLDDHLLPHIDPLLTINNENAQNNYANHKYHNNIDANVDILNNIDIDNWEPPVYTRVYPQYLEMTEANIFTIMDTDIF